MIKFSKKNQNSIQFLLSLLLIVICSTVSDAQFSVARRWNEILLLSIRNDRARPPVHARNLFHVSAAMYDAWAAYDPSVSTWLLGKNRNGVNIPFVGVPSPADIEEARKEAISYAAYQVIIHRFANSPGSTFILASAEALMNELGYNPDYTAADYKDGSPASLGNYIAKSIIDLGLSDGSNEQQNYQNQFYEPVNPPLVIKDSGNPFIINANRWQPLLLETFIDQSGNVVPGGSTSFIGPEWGNVYPFALSTSDKKIFEREGHQYAVYYDPGNPPFLQADGGGTAQFYQWGFTLVSKWGSHLDHSDGVLWDISPASIGNVTELPTTWDAFKNFYNETMGGDTGKGHSINPKTGQPYQPQMVPRGDYTRVLAEFWADGPNSETPPGHWFTILNYVSDYPGLEKKFNGEGPVLNDLEWDIKAYFTLGGAMHDAAIASWGIKGWYDYIRPVSAIRYMASKGQSSDSNLSNFSPQGIPLSPGFVELVAAGDPLAGMNGEHIGKIKLYTWRGPDFINDPSIDVAGIGWILAENWWPYQRPTFVTPPFAGYVSGHSTYSRAAAEVMTLLTGDEYFPGGLGEFYAPKNEFLVFEDGPGVDVTLQWATYRDASDQCSLSRIWGGIHPPQDDIPGRIIGQKVGINAFHIAEMYYSGTITGITESIEVSTMEIFPNPVEAGKTLTVKVPNSEGAYHIELFDLTGRMILQSVESNGIKDFSTHGLIPGIYLLRKTSGQNCSTLKLIIR